MRLGIQDKIARERTITVYTNRDKFFEIMNMKGDKIYVLLLDKDGKILWRTDGLANQKNIESLQKILKKIK
jgi:predicted transcriptional regulator